MLASITREEVNRAVRAHLGTANVKIAMVTGDAEGLRDALAADSPSPMSYASPKPPEVLAEDQQIAVFPLQIPADNVRIVPVDRIFQE